MDSSRGDPFTSTLMPYCKEWFDFRAILSMSKCACLCGNQCQQKTTIPTLKFANTKSFSSGPKSEKYARSHSFPHSAGAYRPSSDAMQPAKLHKGPDRSRELKGRQRKICAICIFICGSVKKKQGIRGTHCFRKPKPLVISCLMDSQVGCQVHIFSCSLGRLFKWNWFTDEPMPDSIVESATSRMCSPM